MGAWATKRITLMAKDLPPLPKPHSWTWLRVCHTDTARAQRLAFH